MKIIHTSDWHLGRTVYGKTRFDEYEKFLNWMSTTVSSEQADMLLISGDVFDTTTPSNRAQNLYYRFLCRTAASACRHVVIIAGNHDSPSFLNAPRDLLRELDIHVIGRASGDPADETLVLNGPDGNPEIIVCAVPYLRDRDIRSSEPGESFEDKDRKMMEGIIAHYAAVTGYAETRRTEIGAIIPIIVMGHLFTRDGKTVEGDGVRELYVGSLAHVPVSTFSVSADYVALGHLHIPQKVGGRETIRYSGSPLPIGFGETGRSKSIAIVEITPSTDTDVTAEPESEKHTKTANSRKRCTTSVRTVTVPTFQVLERITGSLDNITSRIAELAESGIRAWLEIEYTGDAATGVLREQMEKAVEGTEMHLLRIKNRNRPATALNPVQPHETLDDLTPEDVFIRCMNAANTPEEKRQDLMRAYRSILQSLDESDVSAERENQ